jgi:catalytic LigB subunit of aromatic ring-opening dioxygenase
MATLVGVFAMSHSPFCYMPPERWNEVRASRSLRVDVPLDDVDTNRSKAARIRAAFATLREKLAITAPDVIVVFGDDQLECFDFTNFPSFAVYVGAAFEGALAAGGSARVPGHPDFGTALVTGLMRRGFDPAFSMDMPKPARGIGHAFLRPAESLTDFTTPIVPLFVNCYYAPQPTATRCWQLGTAVRDIVLEHASDLRVAVVGSGGLWHTPRATDAYLDEHFDQTILGLVTAGNARGAAAYFDGYKIPVGDRSQEVGARSRSVTGMPGPGGPQGGTRETCNWIAAAAVADGERATIVDYVPLYASPIGAGFASWPSLSAAPGSDRGRS